MKFKVTYYDVETGKGVTKNCVEIDYKEHNFERNFSFVPVDNPPRIYKSVVIDHPIISIYQNDSGIRILVQGYQGMNDGGYAKTNTVIESVRED
jgi:hypothetical protein